MLNVLGRFEKIAALGFVPNEDRIYGLGRELDRVGVKRCVVEWNVPTPFDALLHGALGTGMKAKYINSTLGHYRIIKRAMLEGARSLLVMEDDCRFLKAIPDLETALGLLPNDYDLALLDSIRPWGRGHVEYLSMVHDARVNAYWCRGTVKRVSVACYALSWKGMHRFVELYEAAAKKDGEGKIPLRAADQYLEPELWHGYGFYVSAPNVAIQRESPQSVTRYTYTSMSYKDEGVDVSDYGE